jgi:hypothetical protein
MDEDTMEARLAAVPEIPEEERYTGKVCVGNDGWHYSVKDDTPSKNRAIKIAQADLEHAKSRGNEVDIANSEHNLRLVQIVSHETPDERLFSDGRGNYRLAVEGDKSHNELFSMKFATVTFEDGGPALRLGPDDMEAVRDFLNKRARGES